MAASATVLDRPSHDVGVLPPPAVSTASEAAPTTPNVASAMVDARQPRRHRIGTRAGLFFALLGLTALAIIERSLLGGIPNVLRQTHPGWLIVAAACTAVSIPALALQQRQLLGAAGPPPSLARVVATTYAGNAISVTVPVIGSELAVSYSYRRFSHPGVERTAIAWALIVSGLVSATGFAALAAAGAAASGNTSFAIAGVVTLLTVVLPGTALLMGLRATRVRRVAARLSPPLGRLVSRVTRGHITFSASELLEQFARIRPRRGTLPLALGWSLLNWTADVACLAFSLEAVGAGVPWRGLVLVWAAGSGASSLGLTPGGLGVVEAALALALVGAGVPHLAAVSGVLVYRLFSLWLALAVGWLLVAWGARSNSV